MKKVNPEDLVVGQECYIKVVTASNTITFLSTDNFTTTGSGTMTVSVITNMIVQ